MMRNHLHWMEIENLEPFQKDAYGYHHNWEWLQKLQQGNLTQIDIMRLKEVIEGAYKAGVMADR